MKRTNRLFFQLLMLIMLITTTSLGGNTGKIAGRVTDHETREAIIGVSVLIEGTPLGAATDINGYYTINNVPPGSYTIGFSAVGYQKKKISSVKVSVDFTTKQNIELHSEAVNVEAVIVEADAPLVRQDLTSSHTTVDASVIAVLPVENISQILSTQAGITTGADGELHIRGGRTSEISYTVNGVSIANPFDNSQMVSIATNAIQELSVVSGTFNAEYGNSLSGIVNAVTKEGSDKYKGMISFYTGDYVSTRTDKFFHIDAIDPLNNSTTEATFGGPMPVLGDYVRFFVSSRYNYTKGYLYGIREFNTTDISYFDNANKWNVKATGDGAIVPMNRSRSINTTAKITIRPSGMFKINYDLILSDAQSQGYSHSFKYDPDANPFYYANGAVHTLEITHTLSSNTFYTLRGSYGQETDKSYLYEDPLDNRYQASQWLNRPTTSTFYFGGTTNDYSKTIAKTFSGKFDITTQLSNQHELKGGVEFKTHNLDYDAFSILRDTTNPRYYKPTIPDVSSPYHDTYVRKPIQFAAYIQDKIEYENVVMNFGLRYDYFDPKFEYSPDIFKPDGPRIKADAKPQISPRLGVSFPITDRGIIHFSYGHFFQMPPFAYLYTNPEFETNLYSDEPVFGNANLKPEKNISYEMGLQQQLSDDIAFNVTGFYKDVRDLLALEVTRISGEKTYQRYVNKDYGNIKGVTFSISKRRSKTSMFGFSLDYTFQVAEGNDDNSNAFFLDLMSGRESERQVVYLTWDQTHTLNGTIQVGEDNNWNASLIGRIGSGLPYTPYVSSNSIGMQTNSDRKPAQMSFDLLCEKDFLVWNKKITVFMKVFNLFDNLNEKYVYASTGTATYNLDKAGQTVDDYIKAHGAQKGLHSTDDYYNRPSYYGTPREIRFGFSFSF